MINELKDNIASGDTTIYEPWEMPDEAEGVGFVTAPRGALSHWIKIREGKIENFQLVVPSTWSLGPRCANGKLSPVEEALVGTPVADPKRPVACTSSILRPTRCISSKCCNFAAKQQNEREPGLALDSLFSL
jgi:[NiFe] hydrogenase large subunit